MNLHASKFKKKYIEHSHLGVPGLVIRFVHPRTGSTISLYHNVQAGIASAVTWTMRCETHGVDEATNSTHESKMLMHHPNGWCDGCAGICGG